MHTPKLPKTDKLIISSKELSNSPKGHLTPSNGCGVHKDRRDGRRSSTRSARLRNSLKGEL